MNTADRASDPLGSMPATSTSVYGGRSFLLTMFDRFAWHVTRRAGSPLAFALAPLSVLIWAATGYYFGYSENWQLVINTGATIVTILIPLLIQQSQNKDSVALRPKLSELLAAKKRASNRMIGIEELDEQGLREVAELYVRLADRAKNRRAKEAHSIDEEGTPTIAAV